MDTPEKKKPWIATCESVRWMTYSGVCEVMSRWEWWTLKGLMEIEARLIAMKTELAPEFAGDWFGVRVGRELVKHTALDPCRQGAHLASLEANWNIVETRMEEKRRHTEVRFLMDTIRRLAEYCIPRLRPYEGGLLGLEKMPKVVCYWIRPDKEGWDDLTFSDPTAYDTEGTRPSLSEVIRILVDHDYNPL